MRENRKAARKIYKMLGVENAGVCGKGGGKERI